MFKKSTIFRLFSLLLIAGMVFAALPAADVQAAASGETLYVANWTETGQVGVTGRPHVVFDGTYYHMWYTGNTEGGPIYHTSSTEPAVFGAGDLTAGLGASQSSPAVIFESGTFYMVNYGPTGETEFYLYSSSDGIAWSSVGLILGADGLPTGTLKFDAPSLVNDGGEYKLFFQAKKSSTDQSIYLATSTTLDGTYVLANSGSPVLSASGGWDASIVAQPMVVYEDGTYFMWYSGGSTQKLGFAYSSNGLSWTTSAGNPIIDARGAEPTVVKVEDTWHVWYLAESSTHYIKHISATGPIDFSSIQAAITKAAAGDTIKVAPGTYTGQVNLNKRVSIIGAGIDSTIITGGNPAVLLGASGVEGSPIQIKDLKIEGPSGIRTTYSPISYIDLVNVNLKASPANAGIGFRVTQSHKLSHLSISGSIIDGFNMGFYAEQSPLGDGTRVDFVTVSDSIIQNNYMKGLYADCMSDATFTNVQIINNGSHIPDQTVLANRHGAGLDFNLKSGTYQNLVFNNVTATGNGLEAVEGAAIMIKARGTGGDTSYAANPATLTGVTINGGTFSGNERGIRFGEPGKTNTGPTGVSISNVQFTGNGKTYTGIDGSAYGDIVNQTTNLIDGSPNWFGSASGPASGKIYGNVTFAPWCADAACTTFMPDADGKIIIPATLTADEIQTAIDNAPAGTTIVFSGIVPPISGGYQINNPNLTILLLNGAVISNSSPCFVVNADYTRVTTESLGGAKCVPTNGSNGIDVAAGLTNVIIEGLEIDGTGQTTGSGINFAGAITDVQIINNYIHNLGGNGVTFTTTPSGVVEIQGNLFNVITGVGVSSPSTLNAEYNSWGTAAAPTNAGNVDYDPWTHVDLSMVSTGTPWLDNVLPGYTITYTVSGNFVNAMGADFDLAYPTELLTLTSTTEGTAFSPVSGTSVLDTATAGTISFAGYANNYTPVSGTQTLFTATFTAAATGGAGNLDFVEAADAFSMAPASGSSNNIYAAALADGAVNVITAFPALTAQDLDATFAQGFGQEFSLTVNNPTTGVAYADPQFNFTLPAGTVLEYNDGGTWTTVVGGIVDLPAPLANDGSDQTYTFRVTFSAAGTVGLSVNLVDASFDPDAILASYTKSDIVVNSNYTVTGTFSMQGRTVRSGIPVTLTMVTPALYGPFYATSLDVITGNTTFTNVPVASYVITTNQPRYLNVTVDLAKTKAVSANTVLAALELKGGDATGDNEVRLGDATAIGAQYGATGAASTGDVNFSNRVDIFDLTIVGGNYNLTSATAYVSWLP